MAQGGDAVEQLERELSLLLRRARAFSWEIARQVHPGLDAASYVLMSAVAEQEPVRAADLAELFGVDKSSISRQVGRLVALALVRREANPSDGRVQLLALTEQGRERLVVASRARRARFHARLVDWEPGDVAQLAGLLHRYNSR